MTRQPLDALPLWAFFLLATVAAMLAVEAGHRLGRWRHARAADEKDGPVGAMVGSILGLVAIMLAFTFNLAASRYDARREAVLEEANAIGTTWLRSRLLPEPQRSETAELLREYVDVRLDVVATGAITEGIARSEAIHEELWARAIASAEKNTGSIMTGLFLQSLNEMIDLHAKRVQVGIRSRLPFNVWIALFMLALVGMVSTGYQAGLSGTRRSPTQGLLALAFAVVLFLIVDLDRAREGMFQVNQEAMTDLRQTLRAH